MLSYQYLASHRIGPAWEVQVAIGWIIWVNHRPSRRTKVLFGTETGLDSA
jgi:hypothetical protein